MVYESRTKFAVPEAAPKADSKLKAGWNTVSAPPLDYSFKDLTTLDGVRVEASMRVSSSHSRRGGDSTSVVFNSIRFANNKLRSLEGIEDAVGRILDSPADLKFLDLSFNDIEQLDSTLYLHSNNFTDVAAVVRALARVPNLRILTLHGNPLDRSHKLALLHALPSLKQLDFSGVSRQDRLTAQLLAGRRVP